MAVAFVVTWSSGFVGATLADGTGVGVAALLAWRYLATAAVLVLLCGRVPSARRGLCRAGPKELARQAVFGLLSHVAFLGGVFVAAGYGLDAGISALVCALQPMLVSAVSRRVFGDRLRVAQWAGLGLGLVGVALSVGQVDPAATRGLGFVVGSLVALSGAALLERHWQPQLPVLSSLTVQVLVSTAAFVLVAWGSDGLEVEVDAAFVGSIVWLVVMSGLGGYATFIWCLRSLGATHTSVLLYATPAVTTLWSWAMFHHQPALTQWLGLGIVAAGVGLSVHGSRGRPSVRTR